MKMLPLKSNYSMKIISQECRLSKQRMKPELIPTTAKRIIQNPHYLGDEFYPTLIDRQTYEKAAAEIGKRSAMLGRNHQKKKFVIPAVPTRFFMAAANKQYEDPKLQAEYLYGLIESEAN